ncbi:MAG: DUF3788 domain-containing protein [Candidatus Zixiibacteriota bacterium]|jgi:hypothetical protein
MADVVFNEEGSSPTEEDLAATLGRSRAAWKKLRGFLADNYALEGEWAYYGRKSGWVLRYRKGGKALTTLSPYHGHFKVQIVLGRADYEAAREAALGPETRVAIDSAHAYHDGRWLFLPVKKINDLEDIYALLLVKRNPVKKKK